MDKIKIYAEILGYICVVATMVAALTPSKKDDSFVGKACELVHKLLKLFPTIGINPATRILEEKLTPKVEEIEKKAE